MPVIIQSANAPQKNAAVVASQHAHNSSMDAAHSAPSKDYHHEGISAYALRYAKAGDHQSARVVHKMLGDMHRDEAAKASAENKGFHERAAQQHESAAESHAAVAGSDAGGRGERGW